MNENAERFDDEPDGALLAPEDDIQGIDIEVDAQQQDGVQGQDIAEGRVVVEPQREDSILVSGEMLTINSALANLRAACATYGISSSGSKAKCFKRLMEHQQKLQMQTVMNASRDALNAEIRVPRSPTLSEPPDEAIQAQHRLTHVPYEPWCQSCVAHRARADAHHRDGMASEGDCPVISFDFFYTKAGENVKEEETLVAMVMIDNKTGYLGVVPLSFKAQFDLLTKELIAFTSALGYSSIQLRCDNEPTIVQVAKLTVQARQQMGLETKFETPAAYTHGNGLAETQFKESVV